MTPTWEVIHADCLVALRKMRECSVDAVVTDCPYALGEHRTQDILDALGCWLRGEVYRPRRTSGFGGQRWDRFVPGPEIWRECFRVLRPGGSLITCAGARTQDLIGIAIRIAGFRIVDGIAWLHAQGKPPSKKHMRPSFEPLVFGVKPGGPSYFDAESGRVPVSGSIGRWPANVVHDGNAAVLAEFPYSAGQLARARTDGSLQKEAVYGKGRHTRNTPEVRGDGGSAARFYFCAKASPSERAGSKHKTIKPRRLFRWIIRLVVPPGGIVVDPFGGTGTTGVAAIAEKRNFILIEQDEATAHWAAVRCARAHYRMECIQR